jgi:hypothetical protein
MEAELRLLKGCLIMLNSLIEGSGFFMAICLVIFSFLMPIVSSELRKSSLIMFGYWFVILLHQVVAFLNAYLLAAGQRGTIGAKDDANGGFHFIATQLALNGEFNAVDRKFIIPIGWDRFFEGNYSYHEMLGSAYKLFGVSHLFGEQLSILVFAFSCIVLLKLIRLIGLEYYSFSSLIFFGALPTMVMLGAITLRESYEILFFMLTVYFGVRISINEKLSIPCILLMVISAALMGSFHSALFVYAAFLIALFFVWSYRPISRFGNMKKLQLISLVFIPVSLACLMVVEAKGLADLGLLGIFFKFSNNENLTSVIIRFREGSMLMFTRATYDLSFDNSSFFAIIGSSINIYIHYLFAPFPWQVNNFTDVYAAVEAFSRMILISFALSGWWKAVGSQKRVLGLMLIIYFTVTFLWAIGTTNYGTAIRHNMTTWWILAVAGVPSLMEVLNRCKIYFISNRHSHFLESRLS